MDELTTQLVMHCFCFVLFFISNRYNIFELGFTQYSPLEDRHGEVSRICETSRSRMDELTTQQQVMHNDSTNLVYINSEEPQVITGNIQIVSNVSVENVVVKKGESYRHIVC